MAIHDRKAVWPVAIAILLIAGLTVTMGLCWIAALGIQSASTVTRTHAPHIVAMSCATICVYAIIWLTFRNRYLRWGALACFLAAVGLVKAVDLTFLYYFNSRFLELRPFLPVRSETASFGMIASYAMQYFSPLIAACAGVPFLISAIAYSRHKTSHLIIAVTAAACFIASFTSNRLGMWHAEKVPDSPLLRLKSADRRSAIRAEAAIKKPRTIILAINESTGFEFPSSDGEVPLRTKLAALSGASQHWIPFENAVTNSSATDVSIPSIVTGSGSHESFEKLHAMPFVFDLAKARGYKTAFITSSIIKWAGFEEFFAGASIDYIYTAESSGQSLINDLTIDDAFAFKKLTEYIAQAEDNVFIVFYTNALHTPFQTRSEFFIPASLQNRRARAIYILETGYNVVFKALRESDRFDDALLMFVGDHGDFDYSSRPMGPGRIENYHDAVLSPLFMLKPPAALPAKMQYALETNARRLVANIDIAPTIADLLGVRLDDPLFYAGHSLFALIPEDRVSIAISTNAWRQWPRTAFAVARKRDRLACNSIELCEVRTAGVTNSSIKDTALVMKHDLIRYVFSVPALRQNFATIFPK